MLQSMTGFGKAEGAIGDKSFVIEMKALNGKQFELQFKVPGVLRQYEIQLRNLMQEKLQRGSIDCYMVMKQNGAAKPAQINTELLRAYLQQLEPIQTEFDIKHQNTIGALLRLAEIMNPVSDSLTEAEFEFCKSLFTEALDALTKHRSIEGESLRTDLEQRISNITALEKNITDLAPARIVRIKDEINQLLKEHVGAENIDSNRMEQELIYYMEKIDIHEEQIRLRQHCDYFLTLLQDTQEISKGKKLSFMLQEIGREINTTGSKAYDANIQQAVVKMKDELEKAKEQVLNVL